MIRIVQVPCYHMEKTLGTTLEDTLYRIRKMDIQGGGSDLGVGKKQRHTK